MAAMTSATVDRLLAVLVAGLVATGLFSLWQGSPDAAWIFLVHAWLAGLLVLVVALKLRSSVPRAIRARRWGALALSAVLTFGVVAALVAGYLWAIGGEVVWVDVGGLIRWSVLTIHAWIGLVVLPVVVLHLLPRRWRLLRPGRGVLQRTGARAISRRSFVLGTTLGLGGAALGTAALVADRLGGASRRFTGSRFLAPGELPPPTTFLGEGTPSIDVAAWRLSIGSTSFSLDDLRGMGEETLTATLDCTSGWAFEGTWRGVRLGSVLRAAGVDGARVEVRSVTGWSTSLPITAARACLLAWTLEDREIGPEHGAPLRLVAPDHRGVDWVKWISSIRVG
jgi:DMSO/TMAO reductase YedYZ molybdopterin-dependent catalytic subunit